MLTDHQVYRHGWRMLKAHGAEAYCEAVKLSGDLAEKGEQAASETWGHVAEAVAEIASSIPGMSAH